MLECYSGSHDIRRHILRRFLSLLARMCPFATRVRQECFPQIPPGWVERGGNTDRADTGGSLRSSKDDWPRTVTEVPGKLVELKNVICDAKPPPPLNGGVVGTEKDVCELSFRLRQVMKAFTAG